jgi:RNA polymerase sigma-70 factor (ECF subfamily)
MLASRARNRVRLAAPGELQQAPGDRAVVDAFFAAAGSGDLSALLALLAPDVQLSVFTPEGVRLVRGAKKVAAQAGAGARRSAALRPVMRPVTVRRSAGMLIVLDGRPMFVITCTVQDGLITAMRSVTDPDRLAQIVPSWAT